ncbi:MAG: PaaI family thioesterase [Ruminococcus albus]|nr:PaaI family thioesterase [Ruminococcus albus]
MKNIDEIREFFSHDLYAFDTGAYIEEVGDRYAKVSLVLTERHKNAVGGVMGGVYFTLADFAFAVASNWQKSGTVSLNSDISFIGVPKTEKIFAETELVKDGRSVCTYIVKVSDSEGAPLAAVKIVGFHKS